MYVNTGHNRAGGEGLFQHIPIGVIIQTGTATNRSRGAWTHSGPNESGYDDPGKITSQYDVLSARNEIRHRAWLSFQVMDDNEEEFTVYETSN